MEDFTRHAITVELLPCLFCGAALVEADDHHGSWMEHPDKFGSHCPASLFDAHNDEHASRWNARFHSPARAAKALGSALLDNARQATVSPSPPRYHG